MYEYVNIQITESSTLCINKDMPSLIRSHRKTSPRQNEMEIEILIHAFFLKGIYR